MRQAKIFLSPSVLGVIASIAGRSALTDSRRIALLVLPVFLGLLLQAPAQAQVINGTVTDAADGNPIPGVAVYTDNGVGVSTGFDGNFRLVLDSAAAQLILSHISYNPDTLALGQILPDGILQIALRASAGSLLNDVVVSAGKFEQTLSQVTVSMDVLSPALIDNKNAQANIENVVGQSPGVQIIDGQANIRGGSGWSYGAGSRVLVLLDGMPLLAGDAGTVQWDLIPAENIGRVEVIKGASSVLYGSSALNGVIHLRSKFPTTTPQTTATLFTGFHNTPSRPSLQWWDGTRSFVGINTNHLQKIGRLDLTAGLQLLSDQGYQLDVQDRRAQLHLRTRYTSDRIPGLQYGINATLRTSEAGDALIWSSDSTGYIPLDSAATITKGTDFYIDPHVEYHRGNHRTRWNGRVLQINNTARSDTNNYDNYSTVIYQELQHQWRGERGLTLTGGALHQWVGSESEIFGGRHTSVNMAAYLQADYAVGRWNFSGGGRFEHYRLDEAVNSRPVFRGGLNFRATEGTFVRASFGQGYRFPTMAEKFTRTNVGAVYVYPNADILPETGWSAELGLKQGFRMGSWQGYVDAVGFKTQYNQMMEFSFGRWANSLDPNALFGLGFKSLNIGAIDISGGELSIAADGKMGPVGVQMLMGYTYMVPEVLNPAEVYAQGEPFPLPEWYEPEITYYNSGVDSLTILKYRYRHLAKGDVQLQWKGWFLGGSVRYNSYMENVDRFFESELFASFVPGIEAAREEHPTGDWVMDFRCGFSFLDRYRVALLIDNANNREVVVRPAMYGPPRRITLQLKATF